MATMLVIAGLKMLNGILVNTLITKDNEVRLCSGKLKSKSGNAKFVFLKLRDRDNDHFVTCFREMDLCVRRPSRCTETNRNSLQYLK